MIKRVIISMLFVVAMAFGVVANGPKWVEAAVNETATIERSDVEQLEVSTRDGFVYITTTRPVTVKIFSILGQLISSQQIPAGTHRCRIESRGIYILKAGSITRRITV